MNRDELAHILRSACRIADDANVVVVGSQSILGSYDERDLPPEAVGSIEADISFFGEDGPAKADLVDAMIGEDSHFHAAFGIYAQGVELDGLIVLPQGWRARIVEFATEDSHPAVGHCLDPHDLAIAKLYAWRDKDRAFVGALLREHLLDVDTLLERLDTTRMPAAHRLRLRRFITVVGASVDGPRR